VTKGDRRRVESINMRVFAEVAIENSLRRVRKGSSLQSAHTVEEKCGEVPKTGICRSSDIKKGYCKI
jgi:hypothetical protein